MAEYLLAERSKRDLQEIGGYTEQTWSEEQAVKYLRQLMAQFRLLAERPRIGRTYDSIRPGLLGYHCGKHIIFYRILSKSKVRIVRVLHESMDYTRHL